MKLSHEMLTESRSARSAVVIEKDDNQAFDSLNKAKALVLASWKGTGYATTEQVAEYYQVHVDAVRWHVKTNGNEFGKELVKLTGKSLHDARESYSLPSKTSQALLWTPRAMLRVGMMLTQSEVARQVRNTLLDINDAVGSAVKPLTDQEWRDYHAKQARLTLVSRLIDRMRLKQQFITLFDFVGDWKQAHKAEFTDPATGQLHTNKWKNYEASIVNSAYARVLGGSKKKICQKYQIPYCVDETIRDHLPLEAMRALLDFEAALQMLVTVLRMKPHEALELAANALEKRAIDALVLPLTWIKDVSIACPPSITADKFLQQHLTEKGDLQVKLGAYENRLAHLKQLGGAK